MNKRIAIIGAGPIGLEAALYAQTLGHEVVVYDRGGVAQNVRSWSFVTLFSPWEMNTTALGWKTLRDAGKGDRPDSRMCPTASELLERYVLPLASSRNLSDSIRTNSQVLAIGKDDYRKSDAIGQKQRAASPFRLLVRDASGNERIDKADIVLDCSGTYAHHRWSGRGGVPAPGERALEQRIWYTIPDILGKDRARFAGRHTLVLGAGYSAATVLQNLEILHRDSPQTKASWAIRRIGQAMQALHDDPLPARAALVRNSMRLIDKPPSWLQYLGTCVLERIEGGVKDGGKIGVTLRYMDTDLALAVDEVVALVGYSPDSSIYEQLQVHSCYATAGPMKLAAALLGEKGGDCLTVGDVVGRDTLLNPEPNFFILGAKSFGTNSNFLLQVGHKQVRDAFQLISGDSSLDLYRSAS
jgi:hypothetical protein